MKDNVIISDEELVRRIKGNDFQAKNLLYKKYSKGLKRKIYSRLSSYFRLDLFKDIEQDIWEDIYKSIVEERYIPENNELLPYINQIFIHSFYQYFFDYRIKKTTNVVDEEELAVLFYKNNNQILEENISRSDDIYKCINALNKKQRDVIKLYLLEGLKFEQIARKLNIPPSTVRGQFRTGLKNIRNKLKYMDKKSNEL